MKLKNKFLNKRSVFALSILFFIATVAGLGLFIKNKIDSAAAASTTFSSGLGVQMAGYTAPPIIRADGVTAYCFDFDKNFPTGQGYADNGGEVTDPVIKGIMFYGFGGVDGSLQQQMGLSNEDARFVTQLAVWKRGRIAGIGENGSISDSRPSLSGALGAYYDALMSKTYTNGDFKVIRWTSGDSSLQSILTTEYNPAPQVNEFRFKIVKKDNLNRPVAGVKFQVTLQQAFDKDVLEFVTNDQGEVSGALLGLGGTVTMYAREIEAPNYVVMDSQTKNIVINAGQTGTFEFTNTAKQAVLDISKTDETGANVPNVVFEVSTVQDFSSNVQTLAPTDAQGLTSVSYNLSSSNPFTVYVREKTVPAHLVKSDEVKSVQISPTNLNPTVSFVNRLKKSGLTITKVDADNRPVAGVTFEVRFSDGSARNVTTGANGIAEISNISHAVTSATVRETATAAHLVLNTTPKTVQLSLNQTAQVNFTNQFKTSTLNIVKTDALGAKVPGVVFEVSTSQDFANAEEVTTGAQGNISKQFVMKSTSQTVYVREKSVPSHLVKSDEVKSATLTPDQTATVSFVNQLKKSALRIVKTDADNQPVANVEFRVVFSDGSSRNVTTNDQGVAEIADIAHTITDATVTETSAPVYLSVDTTPKTVKLTLDQAAEVRFRNEFKTSSLDIVKIDDLGEKVPGVVFEISTSSNFANSEEVTTGERGNISKQFVMKSASQEVYVREKIVPAHLVKSDDIIIATLTPEATTPILFRNRNKTFAAEILKVDETGEKVPGVVFEISKTRDFSADVQTLTATNAQGVARSNVFTLANSAQFTLYVREKSVPVHLVKSTEVKEIVVNPATLNNGATFTVSFVNKLKEYPVELSKSDLSSAEPVEGVTLTIYKADDKNNTTKLYESITDKSGKLPGLKLPRGKYKFIETHATIGYKINPNPHYFEVADDGTITGSTVMTDEREEYEFVVDKVDNKGNKVAGVVFSAKNKLTGEVQKATTDANGVAKFKGIWAEYEIKEEETLANLIKDEKVYALKVNPDGSYEKLKVVNNLVEAPKTGVAKNEQANFIAPIVAGLAIILGGATFAFIRKK